MLPLMPFEAETINPASAKVLAALLIDASMKFTVEPLPDNAYFFAVRNEESAIKNLSDACKKVAGSRNGN